MVNPQLLDYIRQQLAAGVSKEEIIRALTAIGWHESDINDGFSTIGPQTVSPQIQKAPTTPAQSTVSTNSSLHEKKRWLVILTTVAVLLFVSGGVVFAAPFLREAVIAQIKTVKTYLGFGTANITSPEVRSSTSVVTNIASSSAPTPFVTASSTVDNLSTTTTKAPLPLLDASGKPTGFFTENGKVYHTGYNTIVPIQGADPTTFQVLPATNVPWGDFAHDFAKDKDHVYFDGSPLSYHEGGYTIVTLTGVDPATFQLLFSTNGVFTGYSKDNGAVYYTSCGEFCSTSVVTGADPATFALASTSGSSYDALDKNHYYRDGLLNTEPKLAQPGF